MSDKYKSGGERVLNEGVARGASRYGNAGFDEGKIKRDGGGKFAKTSTGKSIHRHPEHDAHSDFSHEEHHEAAKAHSAAGEKKRVKGDTDAAEHHNLASLYHHKAAAWDDTGKNVALGGMKKIRARMDAKKADGAAADKGAATGGNVVDLGQKRKEKTAVGKTESGKHFYPSMTKADTAGFTKDDHADVARWHGQQQSNLSEKYHATKNPDGTVSQKHIAARKKIKSQIEKHVAQKEKHRALYEGRGSSPDQRDFDRMDRQNDPQKRSKASAAADRKRAAKAPKKAGGGGGGGDLLTLAERAQKGLNK